MIPSFTLAIALVDGVYIDFNFTQLAALVFESECFDVSSEVCLIL
jgi:hypothetical protein